MPNTPIDPHLKIVGILIFNGRKKLRSTKTGKPPNQAAFYALCREKEAPKLGARAEVCFPAGNEDNQRTFIIEVEKGRRRLTPGQCRFIEAILGWPSMALDGRFESEEDFERHCQALIASPGPGSDGDEAKAIAETKRTVDLHGIGLISTRLPALPSRALLATTIQAGLAPSGTAGLHIVSVQGEAGVGKSHLISEWWHTFGKQRFQTGVFTLDCSRLGGDEIIARLYRRFIGPSHAQSSQKLVEALNSEESILIVLDGLSCENGDPAALSSPKGEIISLRHGQDILAASGRTDRTAFRKVLELLAYLGQQEVSASFLLGIQTGDILPGLIGAQSRLDASASVSSVKVGRLDPDEGALLMRNADVKQLSEADARHLSKRLHGLPISIAAAAHYLQSANEQQVEAFLTDIDSRGRSFHFFEEFFGRYLAALRQGRFNQRAHPHAYLRLLALMPGPVSKERLDRLMSEKRIMRLEEGSTSAFERMQIPFVVDLDQQVDLNPIIRGLFRQELEHLAQTDKQGQDTNKAELRLIHTSAASWYLSRLPKDAANFSKIEVGIIEGALHHLLALRDYLGASYTEIEFSPNQRFSHLLGSNSTASQITRFCLHDIAYRFLINKNNLVTRFLGQFETKARLLSLFFDALDEMGRPRHLSIADQATIYGEIGICWMHAGRLQLAQQSLHQASECLRELDASATKFSPAEIRQQGDLWRSWTDILNVRCLIAMRLGRDRDFVEDMLSGTIEIAREIANTAIDREGDPDADLLSARLAARRVICRFAHVLLIAGDLQEAQNHYELAIALEKKISGKMITGDALRRYIEVLVRRGPCVKDDLEKAEALIDLNIGNKPVDGIRRRLSNDIIPMLTTKIMLLRARGEFLRADELLGETFAHEFVVRGECSYVARIELVLERFRLQVVTNRATPDVKRELEMLLRDLTACHHLLLYWDALIVMAEMESEPKRSELLSKAENGFAWGRWLRRQIDVGIIRERGSAVRAMGC